MTVYVVMRLAPYEGAVMEGIFRHIEDAEKKVKELREQNEKSAVHCDGDENRSCTAKYLRETDFDIDEWEVK